MWVVQLKNSYFHDKRAMGAICSCSWANRSYAHNKPTNRTKNLWANSQPLFNIVREVLFCSDNENSIIRTNKLCVNYVYYCLMMPFAQGWEFAHQFFKRLVRFLWAKEWFACEKEQRASVALLSWATWANRSQLLFWKEQLSKSFMSLFKKEHMNEDRRCNMLLGIKKG